ncbi:MAG: CbtB-domain containing protein [Proteobacteria bacterium]|nr:CbtB-domain containing protein [Pseudomonadota bacterium]MDA1356757.1 CbtB-domain containing protein [Pseudomonadota bacterium]
MAKSAQLKTNQYASQDTARSVRRLWPVFFAALLGMSIIYGVGLADSSTLHNAAHDSRHSLAFPCH